MADDRLGNLCDWCSPQNNSAQASKYCLECSHKLCNVCVSLHGKCKPLKNHKLTDFDGQIFGTKAVELIQCLRKCSDHQSEIVKYVCKDHNSVCCNHFAIATHRECMRLVSLSKYGDTGTKEPWSMSLSALTELEQQTESLLSREHYNQDAVRESKTRIMQELAKVKEELDNAFKTLERKVLSDLDQRNKQLLNESATRCGELEGLINKIKLSKYDGKMIDNTGDAILCYLFERQLRERLYRFCSEMHNLADKAKCSDIHLTDLTHVNEICMSIEDCLKIKEDVSTPHFTFGQSSASDCTM